MLVMLSATVLAAACGSEAAGPRVDGGNEGKVAAVRLEGTPDAKALRVGSSLSITARAYDGRGVELDSAISWSSSDESIATVAGDSERRGIVTAKGAGTVTISATSGTKRATLALTVSDYVWRVRITPEASRLAAYLGTEVPLAATVLDSTGRAVVDRSVQWTSSDAGVAVVGADGLVTPLSHGSATIRAAVGGTDAVLDLIVRERPTVDWSSATKDWVTYQADVRRSGHVPVTLDATTFRERWTVIVAPGKRLSRPVAADGMIFLSTGSYPGMTVALDAARGDHLWAADFEVVDHANPPAYHNGMVFVSTGGGQESSFVWALDANTGAPRFQVPYRYQLGGDETPAVAGGALYMSGGLTLNLEDGSERWSVTAGGSTPAVADGYVFGFSEGRKLVAVDTATGSIEYEIEASSGGMQWPRYTSPVVGSHEKAYVTTYDRLIAFDLERRAMAWYVPIRNNFSSIATLANDVLYVVNDLRIEARSASNGSLLWSWKPPRSEPAGTIVATDNLLFVQTAHGDGSGTYALDLDTRAQVWYHPVSGSLALSNQGVLLIARTDGSLTAIDVR